MSTCELLLFIILPQKCCQHPYFDFAIDAYKVWVLIYFSDNLMSGEQQQGQSHSEQIINLAINVFQNVGIKRWIDQIEILKGEQIYIDICKIIFPQTIIQLIRINENPDLTVGQKIQGVINLIAKEIKNDLYHIQGEAIARGNTHHLKNFLELLEALSNTMICKGKIEVESAPQNDQSFNTGDEHSYYTVIGIDKEFQKIIYYSQEDEDEYERPVRKNQQPRHRPPPQNPLSQPHESSDHTSQEKDFPIKPTNAVNLQNNHPSNTQTNQQVKQKYPEQNSNKKTRKSHNLNNRHSSSTVKKQESRHRYPLRNHQQNQTEFQLENSRWIGLAKRINQTKEELQKQRMKKIKNDFINERKEIQNQHKNQIKNIEQEMKQRKKLINQKIVVREEILQSLKGQKETKKAIQDIFRQEKQVKKAQNKKLREREKDEIDSIMDFNQFSVLFKQALHSTEKHESSRRQHE